MHDQAREGCAQMPIQVMRGENVYSKISHKLSGQKYGANRICIRVNMPRGQTNNKHINKQNCQQANISTAKPDQMINKLAKDQHIPLSIHDTGKHVGLRRKQVIGRCKYILKVQDQNDRGEAVQVIDKMLQPADPIQEKHTHQKGKQQKGQAFIFSPRCKGGCKR